MPRDYRARKHTGRHRFCEVSHMKFLDMFKSLRRRRTHRSDPSQRSSSSSLLTRSRNLSRPIGFADYGASPHQPLSPNVSTSSSLQILRNRSDAVSILTTTEDDCSSGMSTSSEDVPLDAERASYFSPYPFPAFPTSPSIFQLRSTSTRDYLVDRLEQHLSQLSLGDASPVQDTLPLPLRDVSLVQRSVGSPGPLPRQRASPPSRGNIVPMILVTSVDAKHAKPLPPSAQRPSRTPFGPSNNLMQKNSTYVTSKRKDASPDDPFATALPHGLVNVYPPDYNLSFRLPEFPVTYSGPTKYAPETPTPMSCDHFGDCRGDLWEILHPPLVAGRFMLPPFKLPPLSEQLFSTTRA